MRYRAEIDGLRAVAVVPVILFHAGLGPFEGGFIGVDVFFVLSGYLITALLIEDLSQGRFSLVNFYERRARRILPALFFVMLCTLPFAWVWMLPGQLVSFAESLVAVSLFVSNIHFWREIGYFAESAHLKPLLHTWSLAAEEQFYLVFPVILALGWRLGRRRVVWIVVALTLLSLAASEWGWRNRPNATFYLAPTRAWELLAGSLAAFAMQEARGQWRNQVLSLVGLAAIVAAVFLYDETLPWPSGYTLLPVGGTVLLLCCAAPGTWAHRLLSARALVAVGLVSYSAYLWHQPLFALARLRSLHDPSPLLMAALAVLSLVLAALTWRFVEQPFRGTTPRWLPQRRTLFAASLAGLAAFSVTGLWVQENYGFAQRTGMADLDALLAPNPGLAESCETHFHTLPYCYTSATPEVLLWGDSFAMHLARGLVASYPDIALQQHTLSSCAPILGVAQTGAEFPRTWAQDCVAFNASVLDWLQNEPSVKYVILSSSFRHLLDGDVFVDGKVLSPDNAQSLIAARLSATAEAIRATGARVVIVSQTPQSGWDIGKCLVTTMRTDGNGNDCDFALKITPQTRLLQRVAPRVPVYWLSHDICRGGHCDPMQQGVVLYRDDGHLSLRGSLYLGIVHRWYDHFTAMAR